MNREIKFRAWSKVEQKMYSCFGFMSGQVLIIKDDKAVGQKDEYFELMQFTGILDRSGKEIYEGDIVRVNGGEPGLEFTSQVVFEQAAFRIKAVYDQGFPHREDIEVIGNLHENPELIEGGEA
jgi:uncharacterized phage protein (TIGR01671 family)